MPARLASATVALNVACYELTRLLGLWELFFALQSDQTASALANILVESGVNNICMSLGRTLIIGTARLFDDENRVGGAVSLKQISNSILHVSNRACLIEFHEKLGSNGIILYQFEQLKGAQRRINGTRFPRSLANLRKVRNDIIAHFDFMSGSQIPIPATHDLVRCMVGGARVANLCNLSVSGGQYDIPWMRAAAKEQAAQIQICLTRNASA
jgi:hypothetical protein